MQPPDKDAGSNIVFMPVATIEATAKMLVVAVANANEIADEQDTLLANIRKTAEEARRVEARLQAAGPDQSTALRVVRELMVCIDGLLAAVECLRKLTKRVR